MPRSWSGRTFSGDEVCDPDVSSVKSESRLFFDPFVFAGLAARPPLRRFCFCAAELDNDDRAGPAARLAEAVALLDIGIRLGLPSRDDNDPAEEVPAALFRFPPGSCCSCCQVLLSWPTAPSGRVDAMSIRFFPATEAADSIE